MPEIDAQFLLVEVERDASQFNEFVNEEELYFWKNSAEIEERYLHDFVQQPGYAENVKLVSGPLCDVVRYLDIFSEVPEVVRKEAGRQMAEWVLVPAAYRLPQNADVSIQMVCSIRCSQAHFFNINDLEELTKDAVVFNVRFQLGRSFNQKKFFSALTKFLSSRGAATAHKIKIAFWEHDLLESHALGDKGDELALRNITNLGMQLAESFANATVIALEKRVMGNSERERQRQMHASTASEDELVRINSILNASHDPV